MAQVEGGELLVLQRGRESTQKSTEEASSSANNSRSGWSDGPWWRSGSESRSLGSVGGLVEGTKLARASAEGYANDYYAARGGMEEAAKAATQDLSESNPVRCSDIFLALQAIQHKSDNALFDHGKATASTSESQNSRGLPRGDRGAHLLCNLPPRPHPRHHLLDHHSIHPLAMDLLAQLLRQRLLFLPTSGHRHNHPYRWRRPQRMGRRMARGDIDTRCWRRCTTVCGQEDGCGSQGTTWRKRRWRGGRDMALRMRVEGRGQGFVRCFFPVTLLQALVFVVQWAHVGVAGDISFCHLHMSAGLLYHRMILMISVQGCL